MEQFDKKAIISFHAILVYVILILGVLLSYVMNMNNRTPIDEMVTNYLAPAVGMILPIILKPGHKYWKAFLFIVSFLWFVYLLLHYLIGFHNPYW